MATERQIAANRLNGLKGGVKTPEGKAISRMNARKHGIFAAALTEQDAQDLHGILEELIAELKPAGLVEEFLVDKMAVTYLRMQRCAQAETTHYLADWNSSFRQSGKFRYHETVVAIGLYDARLTKQFLRLLYELACRQKVRAEEASKSADPSFVARRATPALRSSAVTAGAEESEGAEGTAAQPTRPLARPPCGGPCGGLARRSLGEGGNAASIMQKAESVSSRQEVARATATEMQNEPIQGRSRPLRK